MQRNPTAISVALYILHISACIEADRGFLSIDSSASNLTPFFHKVFQSAYVVGSEIHQANPKF